MDELRTIAAQAYVTRRALGVDGIHEATIERLRDQIAGAGFRLQAEPVGRVTVSTYDDVQHDLLHVRAEQRALPWPPHHRAVWWAPRPPWWRRARWRLRALVVR